MRILAGIEIYAIPYTANLIKVVSDNNQIYGVSAKECRNTRILNKVNTLVTSWEHISESSKSSTHYLSHTNRFNVSSKALRRELVWGGRGKHACFYTSEYIKTTRGKVKNNQMDLINTMNK